MTATGTATKTGTENGLHVGQLVHYNDGLGGGTTHIVALEDCGLRVRLGGVGYAVDCIYCTPADEPTSDSADFPHVGIEMTWTGPGVTITVRRTVFTFTVETYLGTYRVDGHCSIHATEAEARSVARVRALGYLNQQALADASSPARPAVQPVAAKPRLKSTRTIAKGHMEDMSPSQATAILIAGIGGLIHRGAAADPNGVPTGQLTVTQIRAAEARGWVRAIVDTSGRREIITGCQPTISGYHKAREITR
jgi:hypothetical protein